MRTSTTISTVSVAITLFVWWRLTAGAMPVLEPMSLPSPRETWSAVRQIATDGYSGSVLWGHLAASTWLVLRGFVLALVLGLALGLSMSLSSAARDLLMPIFSFVRPVPPLAWIPLALLWLGLGDGSKLLVITLAALIPVVINTLMGVQQIDRSLLAAARVLGARRLVWLLHVIVPGALPHILVGVRLAMQTCWTVIVAAELLGAVRGVGKVLATAKEDVYPGMVLVGMIAVALLGIFTSMVLAWGEKRAAPWTRA